ncbi:MAG: glycosyltransferase family 4 protein [Erysipelothrix sp.]|nr:glycosyltransferase family 4 protein [Erysipelothrix sp.]
MKKTIKIRMLSQADIVKGQGVSSAYHEQVNLVKQSSKLEVRVNESFKDADIVHHHTINPSNYFRMFNKKYKHVAYVHVLAEKLEGSIKLNKLFYLIFKKYTHAFYRKADYLVVVNPMTTPLLLDYGISKDKIKYIPNYVDSKQFFEEKGEVKLQFREKYNISKDAFVAVGVGQVLLGKGVLDFVEVAKKMPDIEFVWAGGFSFGVLSDGYKTLKEHFENPPKNVKFLGIIDREKMNEVYNASDILFMPSYNEMFPMTILEAVNTQLPVVLRNLELYKHILFEKYNYGENNQDFIDEISKLKSDKNHFDKSKQNAKYLKDYYSHNHVLKLWENFYQMVYESK